MPLIRDVPATVCESFVELWKLLHEGNVCGDVLARGDLGKGNLQESRKGCFKRLALKVLREISRHLGGGRAWFNPAGPACSGEAVFEGDNGVSIMISADVVLSTGILYRWQEGHNRWLPLDEVNNLKDLILLLRRMTEE